MFKLTNRSHEEGDYIFCGQAWPSAKVEKVLSKAEIDELIQQIDTYTRVKPRPRILTFTDDKTGDNIYAKDHLSLTDLQGEDFQKFSREKLKAHCLNYFILIYEGELPF